MASDKQLHPQQRRKLLTLTHALKAVVTVGNGGLTTSVLNELEHSLEHHELLKIKLSCGDKAVRRQTREQICAQTGAYLIQEIGGIIVIYRKAQMAVKKAKPGKAFNKQKLTKSRAHSRKPR